MSLKNAARATVIPGLDGMRALALLLVLGAHTGLGHLVPGGLGVTLFFVLSGYLITTLLLKEYRCSGRIDITGFYLRRVLRLLPPLLVVVLVSGLAATLGWLTGGFSFEGLLAVLFYVSNYWMIAQDFHGIPAGIGVTWSLAVEEQYYLLYPPLLLTLLQRGRPYAVLVLASFCLGILAWRSVLFAAGASEAYIGMATDTRVDSILVGAAMALRFNPWRDPLPAPQPLREAILALACVALLVASLLLRDPLFRATLRYSLQSLAIAALLWLAVARSGKAPWRWLNAPPLIWLGSVSYASYLLHQVVFLALRRNWPELPTLAIPALTIAVTLTGAAALRRWIELPCQRLRSSLVSRPHYLDPELPGVKS